MTRTIFDIPVDRIDGTPATLAEHRGEVMLLVNVASKCGLTPQYEGLEKLFETYGNRGFKVLGFPANDFLQQEPGTNEEIQAFCTANYGVQFPMYSKISVIGPDKHPLFEYLTDAIPVADGREEMEAKLTASNFDYTPRPEVIWNFEKFLISRSGEVVGRFVPDIEPDASEIVEAIEAELAKP